MKIDIIEDNILRLDPKLMELLLRDNSTKKNIVWATDDYIDFGKCYAAECEITPEQITRKNGCIIKPRILKAKDAQSTRTRDKAEVFTPSWVCNVQNNLVDEQWFGRVNVFNKTINRGWRTIRTTIVFPNKPQKTWKHYVRAKRLEISCGEAPYLVSRYDTVTGKPITDIYRRVGLLDRKLRVVNENTDNESDWYKWTKKAYQSVYGYEYQGDSLLLARENLLYTFVDYKLRRWNKEPTVNELKQIANIISWNIWQMDGLTFAAPFSQVKQQIVHESLLFDKYDDEYALVPVHCIVRDWTEKCYTAFRNLINSGENQDVQQV